MNTQPEPNRPDDTRLDALLLQARGHRAPADLVSQVMAATRAPAAAVAWWRRPLPDWPRVAQVAGLAAVAALVGGGVATAERWLPAGLLADVSLAPTPAWIEVFGTLRHALSLAGEALVRGCVDALLSPVTLAIGAAIIVSAVVTATFGFATLRLALAARH